MENVTERLKSRIWALLGEADRVWLANQVEKILQPPSGRNLYMTYTLIGRKIPADPVEWDKAAPDPTGAYLYLQNPNLREITRIYVLSAALEADSAYFIPRVAKLIEVADTGELVTFLKYLPLLPANDAFKSAAVEALRTNIATVFDAISMDNPYPAEHFNEQQWNQMYLKAAFMQRDLLRIRGVEKRANAALARIVSDYAHERWAASRDIDPCIWQPVGRFLDAQLMKDMQRLLESSDVREQQAGYLSCRTSEKQEASQLILEHPMADVYRKNPFDWDDLKP